MRDDWVNSGIKGDSEKIIVRNTVTGDVGAEALVSDTKVGLNHYLDFVIPKGDVGPTGSTGPVGASYVAVLFISFVQAHYSKVMSFQEYLKLPEDDNYYVLENNNILLITDGIYEITLCGQISGVDQNHGAIFYLIDQEGSVIQYLSFELKAGSTSRMDCSETIITKFDKPKKLYIQCGIIGDAQTAKIDFANVNLIIKKYNTN